MNLPDTTGTAAQDELAVRIKCAAAKAASKGTAEVPPNDILSFAQGILWESKKPPSFAYVSPQAESILGYPVEDWLADSSFWEKHLHPDDREQAVSTCQKAVAERRNHELTYRMIGSTGQVVWLHDVVTVVIENNEVVKLYGLMVDVTAHKQMELELLQLRQMLQLVMDTIPDSIFWKNRESIFLGCNRVFAQQAGLQDPIEVVGKTDYDLPWTKDQSDLCREFDQEVITQNEPFYHITETQTQADGNVVWIDMNKLPLHDAHGRVIGVLGTYQNITHEVETKFALEKARNDLELAVSERTHELWQVNQELNLLTKQLQIARDEALAASNIKSDFVANISHEMRTPLAGIIGTAELLEDTTLSAEQSEHLDTIKSSADHLLVIINNVLDLSKIEAGKLELESVEFNPVSLLENTVTLLGSAAQTKQLSLMAYANPLVPQLVTGDPVRLRQILLNLVANAIKFTHTGEVFIRCEAQWDSNITDSVKLRFTVQDTGIGIAPEAQIGLFQPFGQVDKSTTRQYGGTGLGLSICKNLVQLMNGEIGIYSNLDGGSSFWFTVELPCKSPAPAKPIDDAPSWPIGALKNKRVLLVTKTANSREMLTSYLACTHTTCEVVANVDEAIKRLTCDDGDLPFDAAVIEVQRAQDVLDRFAAAHTDDALTKKLVLLSTDTADEHFKNAFVLIKPFSRSQFFCAVSKAAGIKIKDLEPVARHRGNNIANLKLPTGSSPTVLLVEDNVVLSRLGKQQLAKLGVLVQPVSSGEEALEELNRMNLNRANYDLVLMDCQMPGMDGWEVTKKIRAMEKSTGRHVPIIAMTASAMSGDRERCLEAGMDDYLSKPVKLQDLRRIINRWMR